MKGYPTTFLALFDDPAGERPRIREIEIPIIQRDFAQGRTDDETTTLRDRFLDAIVRAVTSDEGMGLDFIWGDMRDGVLRPLDGQQRLTTLFLLHWYVASRTGALDSTAPWLRFSYSTRPSARDFTQTLAQRPYPGGTESPAEWITNQPWYVYPWRQDPTIGSMLVMLDAIHARLGSVETDLDAIWSRLAARHADPQHSTIWFLFLPVIDMDYGEDLYIKMNSRGKPLTGFEVFKADFESILKDVDPTRYEHLVNSMDGVWADVLWEYEKTAVGDYVVDDEFMRYFEFIIDICEWRDGQPDRRWRDKGTGRKHPIEERARLAFADTSNPKAARNRDFCLHAFDTWVRVNPSGVAVSVNPSAEFATLFTAGGDGGGPLPLFSASPDLFGACIANYGAEFSAQETLLLFGVLLARQSGDTLGPATVARRLRSLRNVTAAFLDRDRYMASYVASTEKLILSGTLDGLDGFRGDWVGDEALKWSFMDEHPESTAAVHEIEDNTLIRGRMMAFDLDHTTIAARAETFAQVSDPKLRDLLGAALLTKGDYSRDVGWKGERRQLGSSQKDDSWMDMLTTGSRQNLAFIRKPLMALLDDCKARAATEELPNPAAALDAIRTEWTREREGRDFFDWRYYLARYKGARSSVGDGYFHGEHYDPALGGFSYARLRRLHGANYSAYCSDALLHAAWTEGALGSDVEEPSWWHRDDPGLTLKKSRIKIWCDENAFELVVPEDALIANTVADVTSTFQTDDKMRVLVRQQPTNGRPVDAEDRIQLCVRLVRALVASGL